MNTLHIHPDYRPLLEAARLADFDALFAAGEHHRVDGHRLRSVSRLQLPRPDGSTVTLFLKRAWGEAATPRWTDWLTLRRPASPLRREWKNTLKLAAAGIPVAPPVAWGHSAWPGPARALLALAEVRGPSLAFWLARADPPPNRRRAVARAVGAVVRRLHAAGFSFPDLYAKHLYLENADAPDLPTDRPVWADGHGPRIVLIDVQRLRRLLPWRAAEDLAALYVTTRVPGVTRTDRLRALRAYLGGRRLGRRGRRLARRILRLAVTMTGRGQDPRLVWAARRPDLPPSVTWLPDERITDTDAGRLRINEAFHPLLETAGLMTLDAVMAYAGGEVYRRAPGRLTVRVELADPAGWRRCLYLKRFTHVPWRTKLRRTLSLNPPVSLAERELRGLVRLADIGIPAARLVAVGSELTRRGRGEKSCLITEEIPDAVQADVYFERTFAGAADPARTAAKRRLITAIARLARCLHAHRLSHRDFYLCHLMVRPVAGSDPVLYLIDLQRLTHHRRMRRRWIVKDLAALLFSSRPSPATFIRSPIFSNTDRLRFTREYFGVPHLTPDQKALLRRIVRKARWIARHEARRRASRQAGRKRKGTGR